MTRGRPPGKFRRRRSEPLPEPVNQRPKVPRNIMLRPIRERPMKRIQDKERPDDHR